MTSEIIIIGAGGHAVSIANVAVSCGYCVIGFVDEKKAGETLLTFPIINIEKCEMNYAKASYAVAIGDNNTRKKVASLYKSKFPGAQFPVLVHQSASIGINTNIGEGTVVMPQANIGPNSIVGNFCIANTSSSIDHDCRLGDFASIAPRVVTGGNVTIGEGGAISIGATIKHNIKIGSDTVIGAASYVNKDIEDGVVAYGAPCKPVRSRSPQDPYLS